MNLLVVTATYERNTRVTSSRNSSQGAVTRYPRDILRRTFDCLPTLACEFFFAPRAQALSVPIDASPCLTNSALCSKGIASLWHSMKPL